MMDCGQKCLCRLTGLDLELVYSKLGNGPVNYLNISNLLREMGISSSGEMVLVKTPKENYHWVVYDEDGWWCPRRGRNGHRPFSDYKVIKRFNLLVQPE